jgi:hypothetical protein
MPSDGDQMAAHNSIDAVTSAVVDREGSNVIGMGVLRHLTGRGTWDGANA